MEIFLGSLVGSIVGYLASLIIQERKYKYDLSMVALERKLDVHQKAYTLYFEIINYPSGNALDIYEKGIFFLRENALYLNEKSRESLEFCLSQLQLCASLNDDPAKLVIELKKMKGKGEEIRESLGIPEIKLSSINKNL
jgi:hypothetical protein